MSHPSSSTYVPPGGEHYMDLYDFLVLCESIVESEEKLITEAEDGSSTTRLDDDEFATFFNLDPEPEPSGFGSGTAECFDSTELFGWEPLLPSKPCSAGDIVTTAPPCTLEQEKEVQSATNFNEFQLCLDPYRQTRSEASAPQPSSPSLSPSPPLPQAFSYVFPLQQWPTIENTAYPSPDITARSHAMRIAEMEEDKRRRSNEASARFRAKKKQQDKELERRVAEMKEKAKRLADRVLALETENRALKDDLLSRRRESGDKVDGEKSK